VKVLVYQIVTRNRIKDKVDPPIYLSLVMKTPQQRYAITKIHDNKQMYYA